jgi:hypothetical protein
MYGEEILSGQIITDCIESFLVINTTDISAKCQSLYNDKVYTFMDSELDTLFEIEIDVG